MQHAARAGLVGRLAKCDAIEHHLGIRAEHSAAIRNTHTTGHVARLAARVGHHTLLCWQPGIAVLGLVGGHDAKRDAKRPQQPTPLGGARGEDDQPSSSDAAKWMPSSRAALSVPSEP